MSKQLVDIALKFLQRFAPAFVGGFTAWATSYGFM